MNKVFLHHRIISVVKIIHFVNDRMSYVVLSVHLCNIDVLNIYMQQGWRKLVIKKTLFMRN